MRNLFNPKGLTVAYIAILIACIGITGCGKKDHVDYSKNINWAVCEAETSETSDVQAKEADVFFISPIVSSGDEFTLNVNMEDEEFRKNLLSEALMKKGIYDDNARFFAPYYRQATLAVYTLPEEQREAPMDYAYNDIKNAFKYYLNNYNEGRPLILASYSQGGEMVKRLMMEFSNNVRFNNLLVATYMIDWNMTDEELEIFPYIRMAEGEADTDVMISFSSESEESIEDEDLEKDVQTRIAQYLSLNRIKEGNFSQNKLGDVQKIFNNNEITLGEEAEYNNAYLAKNVSTEMCTAEYWLNKRINIDQVLLSADRIEEFNKAQLPESPKSDNYYYYVGDNRVTEIGKNELTDLLQIFDLPPENTELFYTDGKPVEDEFWEELNKLRNIENVEDINKVRYGIALKSIGVRKGPTDIALAAGEDYDYCDEMQNSSVRMNESLIILWESSDSKWYYVASPFCFGWVKQEDVGVTDDYEYWMEALNPDKFLIVTDNHTALDEDPSDETISARNLDMGTKIALVTDGSFEFNNYDRHALNNYLIKLPCRDVNGNLVYQNAYLPQNISVNVGYLDYTQRNVVNLAFKSLGEQYGWAGLFNNRDCSQYMKEVYRCFGIELPRNTSSMINIPWTSINTVNLSSERKAEILDNMPAGALLIFPGHVMMYLGEEDGEYYCISATGSMKIEKEEDVIRVRSVLVNSLNSTWRGSGKTWLESITAIKLPY